MPGASEYTIDAVNDRSEPTVGYAEDFVALNALHSWVNASNAQLGATTEPDLINVETSGVFGVKWDHAGAATDLLRGCFTVPTFFAQDRHGILFRCEARKVDAGADENDDLKIQAVVKWRNPGEDAKATDVTVTSDILGAAVASGSFAGFEEVELDLGQAIKDSGQKVEPGAVMTIEIGPNETVGDTDMDLQLIAQAVLIRRHASCWDRSLRTRVGRSG